MLTGSAGSHKYSNPQDGISSTVGRIGFFCVAGKICWEAGKSLFITLLVFGALLGLLIVSSNSKLEKESSTCPRFRLLPLLEMLLELELSTLSEIFALEDMLATFFFLYGPLLYPLLFLLLFCWNATYDLLYGPLTYFLELSSFFGKMDSTSSMKLYFFFFAGSFCPSLL